MSYKHYVSLFLYYYYYKYIECVILIDGVEKYYFSELGWSLASAPSLTAVVKIRVE